MPAIDDRGAWLQLGDRLFRQSIDVLMPVLALVAAGQITGIDWVTTACILVFGAIATVVVFVSKATGNTWWQRLIITFAGAFVAVAGTDWAGWLKADWQTVTISILASVAMSILRSATAFKGALTGDGTSR